MVLEDRGQVQDAGAVQPCCMSPPPCRGFPGQERGCKTNHSCNMRESTWRLWRSLKTLQLWQAWPQASAEELGLTAVGGHAGAELLQDVHCDTSGPA